MRWSGTLAKVRLNPLKNQDIGFYSVFIVFLILSCHIQSPPNLEASSAPLRRNVSLDDVGNAAAFLCSDLASGITGEILYVDAGMNILGVSLD